MYRILIVDDERIEREGIKYLIGREKGDYEICEASNGKQALDILHSRKVDLLMTDIRMSHMDGLELSRKAREEYNDLQIVIFSGYSDFSFAQEAIQYGVLDYVLKPVDPERFHQVLTKAQEEISRRQQQKAQEQKEKNFLQQYFLQSYLYSGKEEVLEQAGEIIDLNNWEQWHCGILVETDQAYFDSTDDFAAEGLQNEVGRKFFYLNLNTRQSLFLFSDKYCDYSQVAEQIYQILKQKSSLKFHLAVSRKFEGCRQLPGVLEQLEQLMEEKFYHPDVHIFTFDEDEEKMYNAQTQDSQLMQKISEDISCKDIEALWRHFGCLSEKYQQNTQFSAMYVKFVFSNVIQELFQENQFSEERRLDREVDRLYRCNNIEQILKITRENIQEYEKFLKNSMTGSRDEVASVKNYIHQHYAEDLSLETLAEKVYLSSGYLSYIFKKETGMNLNRYIRVVRMEKAKELLCTTNMKVAQISEKAGFTNVSYFCRSFREYYGSSPESYRKGTGEDEEISDRIDKKN
nr:response regulator [uncultured Blautia sp.]